MKTPKTTTKSAATLKNAGFDKDSAAKVEVRVAAFVSGDEGVSLAALKAKLGL